MRNHGESANPVTYLLLIAVAGALFYGYHVGPLYYDNLTATDAAGEGFAIFIMNGEDAAVQTVLNRMNNKSPDVMHLEVDEEGVETWKPGFGVTKDNVTIDFDESTKMLKVKVDYERVVDFKPLKKRKVYRLSAEKKGTIGK